MASNQSVMKVPEELHGLTPHSATSFDQLYRVAQACYASGLFEDVKDAAQAFVKVLKGQEMGFSPTVAMSAFDIIQKKVFIKPWAIAAKINSCGYGSYRVVESTSDVCTIIFAKRYPGRGWEDLAPVSYRFAEAQQLGLVSRSPQWKSAPQNMLYHRCMGRGGAMYFPELLAGMEMPPDREPVSAERHEDNVDALFGPMASEPLPFTPPRNVTPQTPKPASMWMETVEAHWEEMPEPLRSHCAAIVRGEVPISESEGHALAEEVLATLDFAPEPGSQG